MPPSDRVEWLCSADFEMRGDAGSAGVDQSGSAPQFEEGARDAEEEGHGARQPKESARDVCREQRAASRDVEEGCVAVAAAVAGCGAMDADVTAVDGEEMCGAPTMGCTQRQSRERTQRQTRLELVSLDLQPSWAQYVQVREVQLVGRAGRRGPQ